MDCPDCSICLNAIKKETGEAKLACGHLFHIGCIGRWILKNESCPCCRTAMCEEARINEDKEADTESEYSDYTDDSEADEESGLWRLTRQVDDDIPKFDPEAHAFWVLRTTFQRIDEGLTITPVQEVVPPHSGFRNWHERNHTSRDRGIVAEHWSRDSGYESA